VATDGSEHDRAVTRPGAGEALMKAVGRDDLTIRRFLRSLSPVDQVGVEQRAAMLWSRSIKTDSKRWALDTAVSMVDLTTLEGNDTPGKVRSLCAKAVHPDPTDPTCPRVAAVCLYPDLIADAVAQVAGTGVAVASVATAFPSVRASRAVRLADVREAVSAGADEIDMVIDRGAFLTGRYAQVFDDIVAVRAECGDAHLKVILETGELATYDNVYRASWLALVAGADFIKTSTGKVTPAATAPVAVTMLSAVRDFAAATGDHRGVKLAGGIRSSKDAMRYLVAVKEVAGDAWLSPRLFRFGASSLLNDLLMQRMKMRTGAYSGPNYVTVD
jgi:deoxyribose-phosphate aldolase